MRQEIHFKGLSLTPDNHHAELGALSMCAGVELHDGALRPSVMPHSQIATKLPVPETTEPVTFYSQYTATLRFVHQGNNYTHFIGTFIHDSNPEKDDVYWYDEAGNYKETLSGITASEIKDIQAIGNTLIFVCTTGVYYFLRKTINNEVVYKSLGKQPPFINIQFSLVDGTYSGTRSQSLSQGAGTVFDLENQSNGEASIKEEYRSEVTEKAFALVNRIHSEITESGMFYAPFFIRYCLRLYDGTSLIRHSPPVLMPVCIGNEDCIQADALIWNTQRGRIETVSANNNIQMRVSDGESTSIAAKLQYKCISAEWYTDMQDWSDIVSSLDVFISTPIIKAKQGEIIESAGSASISKILRDGKFSSFPSIIQNHIFLKIPELGNDVYTDKLHSPNAFFKIASFDLSHTMPSDWTDFPVSGSTLSTLAAQQKMVDDYRSHHLLVADSSSGQHSFVYNRRLHIFAANENLYDGFRLDTMLPYIKTYSGVDLYNMAYTKISTESGTKVVAAEGFIYLNEWILSTIPMFYPDSRATEMMVLLQVSQYASLVDGYSLPMSKLPLLEGAYTNGTPSALTSIPIPDVTDKIVLTPNKIYVSEVANPFFFPLEARVTVGIGSIIALATTTRALSQGQFGQYPLIAFCSDGIWALDVSSTGTYQSVHPISREVCVNAASVCQLDQSVLFATSRGLSRIVESQVASVSDALDGPLFDVNSKLGYSDGVNEPLVSVIDSGVKSLRAFSTHPYEFFKEGMLMYDFANSRVIVVKTGQNAAYVLSLKDGTWSTMSIGNVIAVVNGYPYPYCQQKYTVQENNVVVEYGPVWHLDQGYSYATQDAPTNYALVVTRSISFAATMQVIQAFQQIHDCEDDSRTPLLFIHGSNNDVTWKQIGYVQRSHAPYLPGHPYRFFRISIYMEMKASEKYSSLILDVIEKYEKL